MLILFSTLRPTFWHKAANHFDKWQLFGSDALTHFYTIKWREAEKEMS